MVTFADVLKESKSAQPPLSKLVDMVGEIKERHYSITSANTVVGDRVDLLVVTVH
jgi:sulfite reductase (NADPH) flavoprotein alpha-component